MALVLPPSNPFHKTPSGTHAADYTPYASSASSPSTPTPVQTAFANYHDFHGPLTRAWAEGLYGEETTCTRVNLNSHQFIAGDDVLAYLAEQLSTLAELHLQTKSPYTNKFGDEGLDSLVQHRAQTVTKATLNNCPRLTAAGLERFLRSCVSLTEFSTNAECFSDSHLDALIANRKIEKLTIVGSNQLSTNGLLKIAQASDLKLKSLTVALKGDDIYQDELEWAQKTLLAKGVNFAVTLL